MTDFESAGMKVVHARFKAAATDSEQMRRMMFSCVALKDNNPLARTRNGAVPALAAQRRR